MRLPICLLAASLAAPCLAEDQAHPLLGKLFLTPEKRQILERQRQLNLRDTESMESESMQLDGIVLRSSGRNSVWINQHMQDGKNSGVRVQPQEPGKATIETNPSSSVQLQVGDTVNRSTGQQQNLVQPGAIGAKRR